MAQQRPLLEALKHLKSQERKLYGICVYVEEYLDEHFPDFPFDDLETIGGLAKNWPKWSGDGTYPVPAPTCHQEKPDSHCWAYCHLPKWQGEYGQLRMELLDFLIEELENAS